MKKQTLTNLIYGVFTIAMVSTFIFITFGIVKAELGIPSFKVGDCVAQKSSVKRASMPKESWEESPSYTVEKILEVGKKKYRTVEDFGSGRIMQSSNDISWDNIFVKVECTERLEKYNE